VSSLLALVASATAALGAAPPERGVAFGLFASAQSYDYRPLLEEMKRETGATHVSLAWVWWQHDVRATRIAAHETWSPSEAQILATIRHAKRLGLHVTAFPIVRLVESAPGEWRGRIAPTNERDWWESYGEFIEHAARLAAKGGADRLSVGSELVSRERMRGRWQALIDRLRLVSPSLELMYSANWDHFEPVAFWDLVDVVGMTAYFELTKSHAPSLDELVAAWSPVRKQIERFAAALGRRVVITELGYPSLDGSARYPWDETRQAKIDLEEQAIAYEAAARAWSDAPTLAGLYWWNWFGFGGPADGDYTPRGKPAAKVISRWYATPTLGGGGAEAPAPRRLPR